MREWSLQWCWCRARTAGPKISSVQFNCSVVSDSSRPHESQHARPLCPSPTPGVHSDSRPSSQWCHPAISSSVIPFSSCRQSLPTSESFPMSQLFAWGGQSTGVSALASFLISPLISSSILGTYWPEEFLFQYPIILHFHTVHGVLKARILKWFAIPFSSGPHSVRSLHHDPPVLGGPTGMA